MRLLVLAAFVVLQLLALGAHSDQRTIILGGTDDTKNSFDGEFLKLVYTEAFSRLGYQLVYKGFPAKRASVISDAGEVDGEITRVFSYNEKHPDMLRVEEPHFDANFSAYAINSTIQLDGWKSLKGTDYRVVYRRGVKQSETQLPKIVDSENLYESTGVVQGLEMLIHGHTDLFIGVQSIVDNYLYTNKRLKKAEIKRVGVMESTTAHLFLHKKNKHLVDKMALELREMKKEGVLLKYREQVLSEISN